MTVEVLGRPTGRDLTSRVRTLLSSRAVRQSFLLVTGMIAASGLDYAVNVLVGRWLKPVHYGIFISVTALIQVMVLLAVSIRIVVGVYTAEVSAEGTSLSYVGSFMRRSWAWAGRWGLVGTAVLALLGPGIARLLHLPSSWPLWAASLMVVMLFLRETSFGCLQGIQAFAGLGFVQVVHAFLRIVFAALFIWAGWGASGAILAQPVSCALGLLAALWLLRPYLLGRGEVWNRRVSWNFSACTLVGQALLGTMTNLDALFVKHFFSAQTAGDYGPVVTLAKISLWLPWAVGIILVPKVTQRRASGRDPRPVLVLSLLAALLPGLVLTVVYLLIPGVLVTTIFTSAYANPGIVLALASLAATLFAVLNIWLNYALAITRAIFVYVMGAVFVGQAVGMYLVGQHSLVRMALAMVAAGVAGNVAGFITTWSASAVPRASERVFAPVALNSE